MQDGSTIGFLGLSPSESANNDNFRSMPHKESPKRSSIFFSSLLHHRIGQQTMDCLARYSDARIPRSQRNEREVEKLPIESLVSEKPEVGIFPAQSPSIVAAASGLRRSEVRGLKWSNCDSRTSYLFFDRAS